MAAQIVHSDSTQEYQWWDDDKLIGVCSYDAPQEVRSRWFGMVWGAIPLPSQRETRNANK